MPKQHKVERVAELRARIEGSDALLLTDYRGLTVSEVSDLRRSLAQGGTKFAVVKNTLMRRAVNDAGRAELGALLQGPSAVVFVGGDPVAAAKSVVDAAKKFPTLVLKGGYMDGKMLSADDAKALALLESREAMLSKIAGLMKSEMTKAAALFVGAQSKFLSLLEAYKDKVPGGDLPPKEAKAAPAEPVLAPEAPEPGIAEPAAETAKTTSDDEKTESKSASEEGE